MSREVFAGVWSVDEVLADLSAGFEGKLDAIASRNAARQRREVPGLSGLEAPALWEANRRLTRESRRLQALHLSRGREPLEYCPEPDAEAASLAVRGGLSLPDLLKCYRIGHTCTWDAWLELVEESEIPGAQTPSCIATLSRFVSDYDDRLADFVADEYRRESMRTSSNVARTRLQLFRDLIEGRRESVNGLGYSLELHHIGLVAWGPGAQSVLSRLAQALDRRQIAVQVEDGLVMGWLGATEPLDMTGQRALRRFEPAPGVALSVGNPHYGYEGLRKTHREAGDAHIVALRRQKPVTFYDDVALEALALRDETAAREFVESTLAGLNGDEKRSQQLRETLDHYFRSEQNAAATAAAMRVHEATVARHLADIEERLGQRVNHRRAELEMALRLRPLLDF